MKRKIFKENKNPKAEFMLELDSFFKRHNLCIVPTYGGSVSFHDCMTIIPYDKDAQVFVKLTKQA